MSEIRPGFNHGNQWDKYTCNKFRRFRNCFHLHMVHQDEDHPLWQIDWEEKFSSCS